MSTICDLIRQFRTERDLSQAKLSAGICSRSHLSHIESGRRLPSPHVLAKLSDRLDVALIEFFDEYLGSAIHIAGCLQFSKELTKRGYYKEAERALDASKQIIQQGIADAETWYKFRRDYKDALGYWHRHQGEYEAALGIYREYLELCSRRPSNQYHLARAHFVVGNNAIYVEGHLKAKQPLLLALSHTLSLNPRESTVSSQLVIELHEKIVQALLHVLFRLKEYAVTKALFQMTRLRWAELGILEEPNESILLNAGLSFLGLGEIREAKTMFQEILSREEIDPSNRRACLANLGLIHRIMGKPRRALAVLKEAWELYQEQGGWQGRAVINGIAQCYLELANYEEAANWVRLADDIQESYPLDKNPESIAQTLVIKSKLLRHLNKSDGLRCLEEAEHLELSEESRWGIAFEKLRYRIEGKHSLTNIVNELDTLERRLPGLFLL